MPPFRLWYEPAFTFQGVRTRIDVLSRSGGQEFDLIEVKSTTSAKDEHIPDVAIQLYVVEGSGITIERAYLMHINNTYVYQGGEHNPEELFFPPAGCYRQSQNVCGRGDAQ